MYGWPPPGVDLSIRSDFRPGRSPASKGLGRERKEKGEGEKRGKRIKRGKKRKEGKEEREGEGEGEGERGRAREEGKEGGIEGEGI